MTSSEIRYKNAHSLASSVGGISAFARKIDRGQSQVSSFMKDNPVKGIGASMARHIEQCFQLDQGWLDVDHTPTNDKFEVLKYTVSDFTAEEIGQLVEHASVIRRTRRA